MSGSEGFAVVVEGDWSPAQTKTVRNKLQLHFQSKKKSNGGDCRVEAEDGAPRAAVTFTSEDVRARVLAKENHEIILDKKTIKLHLTSPTNKDDVSESKKSEVESGNGAAAANTEESPQISGVLLEHVPDGTSRDVLSMLVENVLGLDESDCSLEIIWESSTAVVTFSKPADAERFLTVSQTCSKMQKHGLTARPLEATKSVRVESLPPTVVKDLLDLYFDKNWAPPDNIIMIPDEEAAIVTFSDPKVVKSVCLKRDHMMSSIPVKVYPYYESLGTALYGKERPTWKMPEPFTEHIDHAVWKYVLMKKELNSINDQMRPYFCRVELSVDKPEVKLSPLPSLLRQKDLTAKHVDTWMSTAKEAFGQEMSQYSAFECPVNASAWEAAEKDVRSVVREAAVLVLDESRGTLTVAGRAADIEQIRANVENIVLKAMSPTEQETNSVSENPANDDVSGSESIESVAVVLENVSDDMSRDLLSMLVKNISGLEESSYSVEIIRESNRAVVTFNNPADAERFFTVSQTSTRMQKHGLTAQLLEATKSVRVESLPLTAVKELLELYFETSWALPDDITVIPDEQAAIVTFSDPKVVENVCLKQEHTMSSIPVKVYPYYESLGTALYGKERPTWKMPEPFTEHIDHAVWKYVLMKKELNSINDQMRPYFCRVELSVDKPEVKLSPLPSLLRQKDLTAKHVDTWMSTAKQAFGQEMSQYSAFECPVNASAWEAAEKDVRSVVKEDAVLVLDESRGTLTVVGRAGDMKQIRANVENIVLKAMSPTEQETNSVSEGQIKDAVSDRESVQNVSVMLENVPDDMSRELLSMLVEDVSELEESSYSLEVMSESNGAVVTFKNPADVKKFLAQSQTNRRMQKHGLTARLLEATRSIRVENLPQAVVTDWLELYFEKSGAPPDKIVMIPDEQAAIVTFSDPEVVKSICSAEHVMFSTTVKLFPYYEGSQKSTITGLTGDVSQEETIDVESCAVVQFINENRSRDWNSIATANDVRVRFDSTRPRIVISGAAPHVQRAKSSFQELISSLFTDTFTVDKSGAKEHFMSRGPSFLSTIMTEFSCVVVLRPDDQEEEEEGEEDDDEEEDEEEGEEDEEEEDEVEEEEEEEKEEENEEEPSSSGTMEQMTAEGLKILLCKGNIQDQTTDVIVNTIGVNMNLNQGAVSTALLQAAGPGLQSAICSEAKTPVLQHGDVVVTKGFELSCEKVFHSVCPVWDNQKGAAEEVLIRVIRFCLEQAEKLEMRSLSIPAIGTGNLNFPRDLVSRVLLNEIHSYSNRSSPFHLTEVVVVVHPNDDQTVDCFTREFKRQAEERNIHREAAREFSLFSEFEEQLSNTGDFSVDRDDSDCAVFDLCADNETSLSQAKRRIIELICD